MKIPKDKVMHVGMGLAFAGYCAVFYLLMQRMGPGPAAAWACVAGGIMVEVYQKVRNEGTPDPWDAFATGLPGLLFWAATAFVPQLKGLTWTS